MTEHCSDCGAELIEGSKFCTECGKTVEQQPVTSVQPEPQQPVEKKQISTPPKTKKKSRKKLIMGLLAIVAAAVIVLIIMVYLQSGTGSPGEVDSRFVGEWEQNTIGSPFLWIFNGDSTLEITPPGTMNNGTWKVTGIQLCFYNNAVCYTYEFSNDGNIVTLNMIGQNGSYPVNIVLTKKGLQGTSQTPDIQCLSDSATNRITIESIDANVKWSDMEITTNPTTANWQVQDTNKNGLARIGTTATITLYIIVGDSIILLDTTGEVTVTLKYAPTNEILGNWTVNV